MNSKQRVLTALHHRTPDRIPIDFGSTFITGIHCSVVAKLREYYGLENRPVKVCEPYQMLGLIEDDLMQAMGIDVVSIFPRYTIFGFPNENWKEWKCPWGQTVLVSEHFHTVTRSDGVYIHPKGDTNAPFSGFMPNSGFFFDTLIRQEEIDEDSLDPEDNLEEFKVMSEEDLEYWRHEAQRLRSTDKAVITHLNGTCLGDIALVPAPFLTHPKGVRDVALWYMTIASDPDFVKEVFQRQTEIALKNLQLLKETTGDVLDVVVVCGTDFGTQESTFCSVNTYQDMWHPYYRKINDWIHSNTRWKTFKHSCGAVESFMQSFIDSGFDIVNPVQCSAKGMDPELLKQQYGKRLTFWGGGVNTQKTLPFSNEDAVRQEVSDRCRFFGKEGGFVFNAIHNIQARTPVENVIAMVETVRSYRP